MADISDVETALVATLTQTIYPSGLSSPSIVGARCRAPYRGWPVPANLDRDMAAGISNITVFPLDIEQNATRYMTDWQVLPDASAPALTLTVSGHTITVGGTPSSPLNAAARVTVAGAGNTPPSIRSFAYPVQPGDTLTSIATGLATLINTFTPATNAGPVITVTGAASLLARVGAVGKAVEEIKRQKRSFRITLWCPDVTVRDVLGAALDQAMASLTFISFVDGTTGRLRYERTHIDDMPQKANIYRRDLVYSVEYGTTIAQSAAAIVSEIFNIKGGLDPSNPAVITLTI